MVLSTHKTKTAALLLSTALLLLSFFDAPLALTTHCSVEARLCYHFFHANIFHAFCNVWCLLALTFYYNVEDWELLLAWLIACSVPVDLFNGIALASSPSKIEGAGGSMIDYAFCIMHGAFEKPVVGFSGICFALMGIVFYKVARKRYYLAWIIPVIAVGFFIPRMAATVHLYCFLVGFTIALVYSRIRLLVIRKR